MPRGRKKDLTTPPSRALAHQRNYRARRAQYVADLETRCRTAEAEVVRLRAELAHATGEAGESDDGRKEEERARAELDVMCRELARNLATTSAAVERFQTRVGNRGGQSRARDEAPTASSPPPSTSNLDLLVTAILSTSPPAARSAPEQDASSAADEDEDMDPSDARCCGGLCVAHSEPYNSERQMPESFPSHTTVCPGLGAFLMRVTVLGRRRGPWTRCVDALSLFVVQVLPEFRERERRRHEDEGILAHGEVRLERGEGRLD